MMILAFFGDDSKAQNAIVTQLEAVVKSHIIDHLDNDRAFLSSEQKIGRVQRLVSSRNRRDTVTVVTGITEKMEYQMLQQRGAVFCVLPGVLPAILSRGYVPIDNTFLYVSTNPARLDSAAKRRLFMTPEEAFSECYRRDLNLKKRGAV